MERFIENYGGENFDLVIIGGGITGAVEACRPLARPV
jgi:glycerol-3-phosphate dehydrogenase